MKKSVLFVLVILQTIGNFYAEEKALVSEEMYYAPDNKTVLAKKKYSYDDRLNITEIETFDRNDVLQAAFSYKYDVDQLVYSEELSSVRKTPVKYSVYLYEGKKLTKKLDYSMDEKMLLVQIFEYDKENRIVVIRDELPDGTYLGKKVFLYKNGQIEKEELYNEKNKLILYKNYLYENGLISEIVFYSKEGTVLRYIKKVYREIAGEVSEFCYRSNFYEFR